LRQHAGVGPGKAVAYVVDENNRTMFSITYVNTAVDKNESSIIVYAYNEHGEARRIYNRLIPFKYHRAKNAHVFMYLERKGLDIKITNFRYDIDTDPNRTKPIDKDVVVVRDEGKFYQRPARIARMYVGKSAKHTNYMAINILGFSLQELLPKQSDITPIEIRQGDLIQIDTHAQSVTINGDDALKLKDFGSNYFNVETGHTELVISPPETFDTTVKWQDRWL
ncbi:phage distal tail protein, partial [Staphylococcus chromogenes]|uniref:phage distal tail protein n=1 Tax=Staphylococcus chromogenes TaxID=46126 RepID=UPI0029051264